jgi:hypothetical protein
VVGLEVQAGLQSWVKTRLPELVDLLNHVTDEPTNVKYVTH